MSDRVPPFYNAEMIGMQMMQEVMANEREGAGEAKFAGRIPWSHRPCG